jgi:hypothetical protein
VEVGRTGELARGVHRQDRDADVNRPIPIRVAVIGPIVDPQGTALFDTNS